MCKFRAPYFMQHPRPTRSSAKSLASLLITTALSSQPTQLLPSMLSHEQSMSDPDNHDVPPHLDPHNLFHHLPSTPLQPVLPPANPPMDPAFQAAMMAFFTMMTQQMQVNNTNLLMVLPPVHDPPVPRSCMKTCDPDTYDGSDPTKLRSFLSQCLLVFRSRPDEYHQDSLKILYAVFWLSGTAQSWYEPNLTLDEEDLPNFACTWQGFEEALNATFGEPDPVASATSKLDNLTMKDHHHLNKYDVEFNEYATFTGS